MNQSENINELAMALSKAQGEMQAAIKDSVNPFFKSKYADLGSVWDAARPVLSKNGLCIMQTTEMMGEKIVMITTLAHTSGQWMKSILPLNPSKNDTQGVGAAITYLRRYSLSALVGVVCDDDDDGETAVGRGKTNNQSTQNSDQYISKSQMNTLSNLLNQLDEENKRNFFRWIKDNYKANSIEELLENSFERCVVVLNAKIKYTNDQKKVA